MNHVSVLFDFKMSQCQHVNRFAPFQDQCQFPQFHIQDCIAALYLKRPHQSSRALAVWLKSFTRWYVVYQCIPLFTSPVNSSTEFFPVFILQGGISAQHTNLSTVAGGSKVE